jgi:hypothetical protein
VPSRRRTPAWVLLVARSAADRTARQQPQRLCIHFGIWYCFSAGGCDHPFAVGIGAISL